MTCKFCFFDSQIFKILFMSLYKLLWCIFSIQVNCTCLFIYIPTLFSHSCTPGNRTKNLFFSFEKIIIFNRILSNKTVKNITRNKKDIIMIHLTTLPLLGTGLMAELGIEALIHHDGLVQGGVICTPFWLPHNLLFYHS